jgi:hypothetical protein
VSSASGVALAMCLCHQVVCVRVPELFCAPSATITTIRCREPLSHCFPVAGQYGSVAEAVVVGLEDPFMATVFKYTQDLVARQLLVATGRSQLYQGTRRDRLLEYVRGLFSLGQCADFVRFPRIRFVSLFPMVSIRHSIESILVRYPVLCTWICTNASMLSADDFVNINRLPRVYLFLVANRLRVAGADVAKDVVLQTRLRGLSIAGQQQLLRELLLVPDRRADAV